MGNNNSVTNTSINTIQAISEAYLSITQNISQGIYVYQNINIDCSDKTKGNLCMGCINTWQEYYKSHPEISLKDKAEFIRESCRPACECYIDQVNISQKIIVNFSAFLQANALEQFKTQIMNSINQQANYEQIGIFSTDDKVKNIHETVEKLYAIMKESSFQKTIQQLQNTDNVVLIGPAKMVLIDMSQAMTYINTAISSNAEIADILTQLETNVIQLATQVTSVGLAQIIFWIVKLVILLLIIILLLYAINLVFQIYALYV